MYGLETIRGSNCFLDDLAKHYTSYFTIDWSFYDQTLSRIITDLFYSDFLPSLIVINAGYAPTHEYPHYPDLNEHDLYKKMNNLLSFLHTWYNNMTFVTQDGFGYRRTSAGIPSGQLLTQYLGSFGNIFLLTSALIAFGCTDHEIESITIFVMGDDNTGFTLWNIKQLEAFISFLEEYAKERFNMTLSKSKSILTILRNKIESLGYTCNFGRPTRSITKLVAQLCMPERYTKDEFMSARAIGIAYAACACDETFHRFCYDVYNLYLPFSTTPRTEMDLLKVLPTQFSLLDKFQDYITIEEFPSLLKVQSVISKYHGPLSLKPKWSYDHFRSDPFCSHPHAKTMSDYRKEHNLTYVSPVQLLG
jgi:hypothetical protein